MYNLLTSGSGTSAPADNGASIWFWVVIAVLLVAFFAWSYYSSKKKNKKTEEMITSIKIGDKIKTIGGICGYAYEINDDENTITLRTGPEGKESYIKFDKGAIYQTAPMSTQPEAVVEKEPKVEEVKEEPKKEKKSKKAKEKVEEIVEAEVVEEPTETKE